MNKQLTIILCVLFSGFISFSAKAVNHPPSFTGGHNQTLTVCENASATAINSLLMISDIDAGQTETWLVLRGASHGTLVAAYGALSTGGTITPSGLSYTPTTGYSGHDTFSVRITDGIASDTTTVVITVNPLPSGGTITGPSGVCVGMSVSLTDATPGGVWTVSNTNASITGGSVTGIVAGIDTVKYSVTTSCGSASTTATIMVNPLLPSAGSIIAPSILCIGSSITMSDAVTGGVWTASNANAAIAGAVATGATAGIDTITYTVTTSCGTANTSATIAVTSMPSVTAIIVPGFFAVCPGDSILLVDTTSGGVWGRSNSDASVDGLGEVKGIKSGVDTIMYTVSNACGSAIATQTVTVKPLPNAGVIKGASAICVSKSITLSDAVTGGTWGSTDAAVAKISSAGVVKGVTSGTSVITYSVKNDCGMDTAKLTVSVDLPALPIFDSSSTVCQLTPLILIDLTTGGTWSSSNPLDIVFGGAFLGLTAGTTTVTYTVTNGCGTTTATVDITVLNCSPLNTSLTNANKTGIEIYPNPANGEFSLNLATNTNEAAIVRITNMVGETIKSFTTITNKTNNITLDVPQGIYFITAIAGQERYTGKITITK